MDKFKSLFKLNFSEETVGTIRIENAKKDSIFDGATFASAPPTIYRKLEAKGWGETWGGRPVKLISEKP